MPINAERLRRLTALGLTESQARAYLALLDLGEAAAKDVATLARIPKAKVYGALDGLVALGLAEARPAHPRVYAPLPLADHVRALARDARRRADELDQAVRRLAEEFAPAGDVALAPRGGFAVLRGRRNVHARVLDLVAAAEERLLVRATPAFAERLARGAREALLDARLAGVAVVLALPLAADDARLDPLRDLVDAREAPVFGEGDVSLVVADGRSALLARAVPDDAGLRRGDDVALVTKDPALARALEDLAIAPLGTPEELFYRARA